MSGIFKGDSIYKSGGGGGGGYKDGGELIDGAFIEVKNNTVSSYDNVSRNPINFYIEVTDGEILNSVVELTTEVNATINVYYVKNGLYYLLGNVGGNTVNAGDDYKINIVGNSFVIEVVTPSQDEPEIVELDGILYPCKVYNGLLWLTRDLQGISGVTTSHTEGGYTYFLLNDNLKNINLNGWRIPIKNEWDYLISNFTQSELKRTWGWNYHNGTNTSKFSYSPGGFYQYGADPIKVFNDGVEGLYASWDTENNRWDALILNDFVQTLSWGGAYPGLNYYCIRLVKDI